MKLESFPVERTRRRLAVLNVALTMLLTFQSFPVNVDTIQCLLPSFSNFEEDQKLLRIHNFAGISTAHWFGILLGITPSTIIPVELIAGEKLLHFAVVTMERMWLERNRIRLGGDKPDWKLCTREITHQFHSYWKAALSKIQKRQGSITRSHWQPPSKNEFKINFDATFSNGVAYAGVIMRDYLGQVRGAWTNKFLVSNAFCAEIMAANYAFQVGETLKLDRIIFEGDALFVILAVKGCKEYEDWRATDIIQCCRNFLKSKPMWFFEHVNRQCNFFAHNLASWAKSSNFCGEIDVDNLPPGLSCKGVDSDISFLDDECND